MTPTATTNLVCPICDGHITSDLEFALADLCPTVALIPPGADENPMAPAIIWCARGHVSILDPSRLGPGNAMCVYSFKRGPN